MKDQFIQDENSIEPDLWPEIYGLKKIVYYIFSIPVDNSIGTVDIDNGLMSISFEEDKLKYTMIRKNYLRYVSGGKMILLPALPDDVIGYAQESRFVLFNIKDKTFEKYLILDHYNLDHYNEELSKVMVLDWEKRHFIFEHLRLCDESEAKEHEDCYEEGGDGEPHNMKIVRVLELRDGNVKLISKNKISPLDPYNDYPKNWIAHDKKIVVYKNYYDDQHKADIEVYDYLLNDTSHPLVDILRTNAKKIGFIWQILIHPTLSFAVVRGGYEPSVDVFRSRLFLIRWDEEKVEDQIIPYFPYDKTITKSNVKDFFLDEMQFSPDGRWFVIKDGSARKEGHFFIAMFVDPDNLMYFGQPQLLGRHLGNAESISTAWAENPLSFVACYGNTLYRWELDKLLDTDENDIDELKENDE